MALLPEGIGFRNPERAGSHFAALSTALPRDVRNRLVSLLAGVADPDEVLDLAAGLAERQPEAFHRLVNSPGLPLLISTFDCSRFLSEELHAHPDWLEQLVTAPDLRRVLSAEEFRERFDASLPDGVPSPLALARFRRRQILRILLRDVRGLCTLSEATEELSHLADALIEVAYRRIRLDLVRRYGTPRFTGEPGEPAECGFSVVALGKLGGRELNYSSEIDLMFVYSGRGETDGAHPITNIEFFKKTATQLVELLSTYTAEGMVYRVDLRLRPDGRLGEMCMSLGGARSYYQNRARDWELQMLIKARVAAGEREPGRLLLEAVEPLIYSTTLDFSAVEAVSATRERLSEKLAARRGAEAALDVKLARGGIRDVEFLVQCLQRLHGGREPWVRHGGTLLALFRLRDKGLLSPTEYAKLASAYQFYRHLEHRLQFAHDQQTHALPRDTEELDKLARRMPPAVIGETPAAESLLRHLNLHLEAVQEIYERVIHAQKPVYYTTVSSPEPVAPGPALEPVEAAPSNILRFLDQKAPRLAEMLARRPLDRGARNFEHFLEKVLARSEWLKALDGEPVLAGYVADIFQSSPYFAEQLIRSPELIAELRSMAAPPRDSSYLQDISELRRFFRHEMFRIQAESICLHRPIFETLERTSELAEAVIAAAYRMALEQAVSARPPESESYVAVNQMMVIALGRLGMREFDLGSDADLVFVLPDADAAELAFWTRVAERIINMITAYTGEGVMFAVDTRLRPNGREGALVQLESGYKDYFERSAEAWEGITYMKSRGIAGNVDRATEFLNMLQEVDWRRYGQSGRSQKELRRMRMRLEKEQGEGDALKAGPGGYYDIDFALMYLRLKGAGIFYKVLNTTLRIDVIEKMGHLERADAMFLRDAATLFRAVDHGLRIISGHTEGDLPTSEAQLALLAGLVSRWTPDHLHDQPLPIELAQIRTRTRALFDRLFA